MRMPRLTLAALLAVAAASVTTSAPTQAAGPRTARAQDLGAPAIVAGDRWTYQSTRELRGGWRRDRMEITVLRASPSGIEISTHPVGSTMPPVERLTGLDWSRVRSVDGREQVVNRPLDFPMHVGESWVVDYGEAQPSRQHSSEHFRSVYRVVGWQEISVPAGLFRALKVEADGTWSAVLAPSVAAGAASMADAEGGTTAARTRRTAPTHVAGRTYKAFWYVPTVKRWVKSVEEYYDGGLRSARYEDELLSFKPAQPG